MLRKVISQGEKYRVGAEHRGKSRAQTTWRHSHAYNTPFRLAVAEGCPGFGRGSAFSKVYALGGWKMPFTSVDVKGLWYKNRMAGALFRSVAGSSNHFGNEKQ